MVRARGSGSQVEEDWAVSVLLPVYDGAEARHLARALDSLFEQTLPPREVVVVEDGPLRQELVDVLERYQDRSIPLVRVVLPENLGIGPAAQRGLERASGPWVARMDADDISLPHRLERQMTALRGRSVDVLGSAMVEFEGEEETNRLGVRSRPLDHEAIARAARMNNPVNHATAVIRRSAALAVGGYRPLLGAEDYDLFARLLAAGYRFGNLPDPLYLCRAGDAQLRRRTRPGMLRAELALQRNLTSYGIVSRPRAFLNVVARTAFRALPSALSARVYRLLFYRSPGVRSR